MRRRFGRWRGARATPVRAVACWHWRRSTTAVRGAMRARIGSVGLQTVRDWVLRFNAAGPAGLVDGKAPGQTPKLNEAQRQALARIVESGPIPAVHGVVRWRLIDLAQWVWEEYRVSVSKQTLSRELRAMDFRKLSARPRHRAQNEHALEAFKKTSPPSWRILHGAKKQAHG